MSVQITLSQDAINDFCRRHGVKRLALFGSVVRDDFTSASDVDVLIDFLPETKVGYFTLLDLESELSGLMGGRRVEISTPESLSRYYRDRVNAQAVVQYERA